MELFKKNLAHQIHHSLDLSSFYDIYKVLRVGERALKEKGDVTLPLQPILAQYSLLRESTDADHHNDSLEKEQLIKNICSKLEDSISIISCVAIDKGSIIRIHLNRNVLLSQFPQVLSIISNGCATSHNRLSWDFHVLHHVPEEKSDSVRFLRGSLIADLLQDILVTSTRVLITQDSHSNNESSYKCRKTKHVVVYGDSLRNINLKLDPSSSAASVINGPVIDLHSGNNLNICKTDYLKHIKNELDRASRHKLGDSVSGEDWEIYLDNQADACTRLQLLSVAHHSPIKVSLSSDYINSRDSSFILYNYARIRMIFNNFGDLVESGCVPPLPPIEAVEFSLLQHQEEWELYWVFIHYWPDFIYELCEEVTHKLDSCSETVNTQDIVYLLLKLKPCTFSLHKITNFLHRLAHKLSVYYKSIHILPSHSCGKVPLHLLPKLWARLHLLRGLQLTMEAAFKFLRIKPPSVM